MSLAPGSRVGVYDVVGLVGAGGMGEVYRARDSRLSRDVAIKVLPDLASGDPDRVARFEREARALAALNHPNIAAIHQVEEIREGSDRPARTALILEFVEGETLADRLLRGPLAPDAALATACQIADAVGAAHAKGIVHRDLKPANVKLTPDGQAKVLDFGLARMAAEGRGDETITVAGSGLVVGTPAYMAPEQALGRPVDARADVWAFGILLFEMLTGERPFRQLTVHELLEGTVEPDWSRIPGSIQPVLRRCLERDPRRRLRDLADFRFLVELASGAAPPDGRPRSRLLMAVTGLALAALVVLAAWGWFRPRTPAPGQPVRFTTLLPTDVSVTRGQGLASSVAVSPDGRTIVVAGTSRDDGPRLYRQALDSLEAVPIAGTERGSSPFFSHDGAWIGFFADGRVKRVPASGGAAVDIAAVPGFPAGASWGADDRIVFAQGAYSRLYAVDAQGGSVEAIGGVQTGYNPQVLPDGRGLLFEADGWIHILDRRTGQQTRLLEGASPRFVNGHIVLSRGAALLAAPVDLRRASLTGPVVPLVEGVALEAGSAAAPRHYAAGGGTLAYVPAADEYALVLVQADRSERVLADGYRQIQNPRFSPDGRRLVVAITRRAGEASDLWTYDLDGTGAATRLTFEGGRAPVWTPDGVAITYSHLGERRGIYQRRPDGTGPARLLVLLEAFHWLVGWTPDGSTLAYGVMEGTQSSLIARTDGEAARVVGPGSTWGGRLSRDGRWLTYYLLESGNFEVYVTPFPEGGSRWLIAEGTDPAWSPDGSEIYYRNGVRLMAARIEKKGGIRVLSHRVVVEPFLPPQYDDYDVHRDGKTLVLVRPAGVTRMREVVVAVDWLARLR